MGKMAQQFGGSHTEEKLNKLEAYLDKFTTVLKFQSFSLVYFDAFAGTPDIDVGAADPPLFLAEDARPLVQGSSRRALKFGTKFAKYIFVEGRKANVRELEQLKIENPNLADRIEIRHSDANTELHRFCAHWPTGQRAVVFLDPFGNDVEWETIVALANTQAIDLWYLFPAGLGVARQISKDGNVHYTHGPSLDRLFGTTQWRSEFLEQRNERDLFDTMRSKSAKAATPDSITRYMIKRMKTVFKGGVLDEWLPLGSRGIHLYSLLFAWANPSEKAKLAGTLARAVLRSKRRGRAK
jgi:three-Cys-motif partner protein